jgi:hypothetical protein
METGPCKTDCQSCLRPLPCVSVGCMGRLEGHWADTGMNGSGTGFIWLKTQTQPRSTAAKRTNTPRPCAGLRDGGVQLRSRFGVKMACVRGTGSKKVGGGRTLGNTGSHPSAEIESVRAERVGACRTTAGHAPLTGTHTVMCWVSLGGNRLQTATQRCEIKKCNTTYILQATRQPACVCSLVQSRLV